MTETLNDAIAARDEKYQELLARLHSQQNAIDAEKTAIAAELQRLQGEARKRGEYQQSVANLHEQARRHKERLAAIRLEEERLNNEFQQVSSHQHPELVGLAGRVQTVAQQSADVELIAALKDFNAKLAEAGELKAAAARLAEAYRVKSPTGFQPIPLVELLAAA